MSAFGISVGVRRAVRGLGLATVPRLGAPGALTALRGAILRRPDTASSSCAVPRRPIAEPRLAVSLRSTRSPLPRFLSLIGSFAPCNDLPLTFFFILVPRLSSLITSLPSLPRTITPPNYQTIKLPKGLPPQVRSWRGARVKSMAKCETAGAVRFGRGKAR